MLEVQVETVATDPFDNPVMILRELESTKVLPVWIGHAEAHSIIAELKGEESSRPLTHDLLRNTLEQLDVKVTQVIIRDLVEKTYHASIILERDGASEEIDARPSDAVALALRTDTPVFVSSEVAETMVDLAIESDQELDPEEEGDRLERMLGSFGKDESSEESEQD